MVIRSRGQQSSGHVDKRFDLKFGCDEIGEARERHDCLVVAGCDTPHRIEPIEHAFDAVSVLRTTRSLRTGVDYGVADHMLPVIAQS